MSSIWQETAQLPRFDRLERAVRTDVLVIGGGMAGILCAHMLHRAGVDCVLVEAGRLCGGVTGRTTAKVTAQHGLIYHKLVDSLGEEQAQLYLEANRGALEEYRRLCRDVDCGFEERDACVYTLDKADKVEREAEALRRLGVEAEVTNRLPLPFPVAGAVRFPRQAQFHPLEFAAHMVQGLRIFEHTRVTELRPGEAVTEGGVISAERVVVATHFPFLNRHGSYFLKLYQHRSHVLALEGVPDVLGMYVDEDDKGLSFRSYGRLLLLGGGGHRTGKEGGGWRELEDFARRHWPKARVAARWATQDCMTLDGVPYIGRYSARTPDLYVATGFHKWGMTSSMVAAGLLTDLMVKGDSPYTRVFSPSRSMLRPQLAVNGGEAALSLLTPTVPRCPHMGCALKYNREEGSWDCPCHGSRFREDGGLLNGPAAGALKGCPGRGK